MDKNIIKKYLKIIGIYSIDQLNQNSIDYWWKRKKIEVKSSYNSKTEIKENLIKINEAKEFLDKLNIKNIKSLFEVKEDKIIHSTKKGGILYALSENCFIFFWSNWIVANHFC